MSLAGHFGFLCHRDLGITRIIASPHLTVEPFLVPDPLADLPEASLSWEDRLEREEQADAAWAATPAPVPLEPSVLSWEAVQLCLDFTDLQDLDVITAVQSICSGQAS